MNKAATIRNGIILVLVIQITLSLFAPHLVSARARQIQQVQNEAASLSQAEASASELKDSSQSLQNTTLAVNILSAPWTVLDSNDPNGTGGRVPKAFIVQAEVKNTGSEVATDVVVNLNYNNPANNWILLAGESPVRTIDQLDPGQSYHAYWFARYSTIIGSTFQYSVTADAANANPVTTNTNFYGNPVPGATVQTRSYISTGNSGVVQTSANVIVGVAFTVTVSYDLGSNPQGITFSPAGNLDFDPGSYRLLSTQVRFYNDAQTQEQVVQDRLFYNTLPDFAENAEVSFTFIAVAPEDTVLCPYGAVDYNSTDKYDNFYCRDDKGTSVPIDGSLSVTMSKQVSSAIIQQGQTLNYTIQYTNTGTLPLQYVWLWDEIDTNIASIVPGSISPAPDAGETTSSLIAWNIGNLAAGGQPGSSGTLSFSVLVDGNGNDLPDNTSLLNTVHFGINQDSLPEVSALNKSTTTIVQAPTLSVSKSDGQTVAEAGSSFMYTLNIANTGSVAAPGLVITDVLPAQLTIAGAANPPATSQNGQTLVWNNLGPIAAAGGSVTIQIPVSLAITTPSNTVLTNQMDVQYENPFGYRFDNQTASDITTVIAPTLSVSKSDSPDPVLAGNELVYTLHYVNTGSAEATNVTITDNVPTNTTYQSCSGGITCSESGGVVTWNMGTVASNSSGDVTLTVLVSDALETGTVLTNDTYGLSSDQSGFIAGAPETTTVNRDAAIIQGYAFNDANGNGIKDTGETAGYNNVTISLSGTVIPLTTTTTASDGFYSFRIETGLPISVSAPIPAGTFRTTPGQVFLDATLGVTETVNFGYADIGAGFGVVFGTVFEDKDYNGTQTLGESGLTNVQVAAASAATTPVSTNSFGQYTLRFNAPASTIIIETNPTYYVSTTPDEVPLNVVTDSSNGSPINFGDFLGIQITGQVFEDLNVDGSKDLGEVGLSGADVTAGASTVTTDNSGLYNLYVALNNGNPIEIAETDPAGYVSTNAIPGNGMTKVNANLLTIATPVSGTVYMNGDFGDVLANNVVTVTGQVWDDNGAGGGGLSNGLLDGAEPGLAGALVQLSTGLSQTTGTDGNFLLYAPAGQPILVTETNPVGFVSTNAIPGNDATKIGQDSIMVSALSGGSTSAGNLFGDVLTSSVATIAGTIFDDSNENGQLDAESGIAGVQVTLEYANGNAITVTTDSNGAYEIFAVAPGAMVSIHSHGPGGLYYPTTPETVYITPPAAGTFTGNNFGYSNDGDAAVITGIVFNDINSDGVQDFGELGLAGAVLTLDGANPITTSGNGLITGTFTYPISQVAIYALDETNPSGYRSTTPDSLNIVANTLGASYFAEFGDTNSGATGTVYGTAFDDLNGNGLQDLSEPGLPGVVISMTVDNGVITATTKPHGQYTYGFEVDQAGFHTVREQDPALPGYRSTTPDSVNVLIVLNVSKIVNFGDTMNASFSTIMGTVFNDESSDGDQDPAELGIAGVAVSLSNGMATTTDANGNYTFPLAQTGFLEVVETDPPGYHSTTPNEVTVHVDALGEVYRVNFGDNDNLLLTSIFGTVFEDQNVNGQKDATEPGLSGVTVEITGTFGQQLLYNTAVENVTNEWGQYTFLIENTGIFTVTETDLSGYISTNAIPGSSAVTKLNNNSLRANVITLGTDLGNNLFADVLAAEAITITGEVWNDNGAGGGTAGDGVRDPGEPGLAGAKVSLSSGTHHTTGPDGSFSLVGPANQVITVTETNPIAYLSTNAIPGNGATKIDDDTLVISALSGDSISSGNKFGDILDSNVALIFGTVFQDSDGDGIQDSNEIGIPNVEVTLDGTFTTTTDSNGGYFFATDVAGIHTVVETDPVGYFSTTPNEVHLSVVTGQGESYQVDFGDAPNGSGFAAIYGTVFEDLNGNGQQDPAELGIPGVTVTLDGATMATTNPYGGYTFATTVAGVHAVVESDLAGYFSTTPNEVHVSVAPGESHEVNFGDALIGSGFAAIYGTVFEDTNTNGQWDSEEVGIAGVTINADGIMATTGLYGSYTISTTSEGTYAVVETDPPGYVSTTPNTVNVVVVLDNGYQVDFGDVFQVTCDGDAYEEDDAIGQAALIGNGTPAQARNFCDDASDWISFTAAAGTTYTITTSAWGTRADTVLALYDTDGTTLLMANDDHEGTTDFSSRIVWEAAAAGDYYLHMTNKSGLTQGFTQYDLWIEASAAEESPVIFLPIIISSSASSTSAATRPAKVLFSPQAPSGEINHFCPDAYEMDDTWQEAQAIALGEVQTHSFDSNPSLYAADKDYVWVDLDVGETITFTITKSVNTQTLLELVDENGELINVTGTTNLQWTAETAGRYYLGVSPLNTLEFGCTDTVSYDLTVSVETPDTTPTIYLPFIIKSSG